MDLNVKAAFKAHKDSSLEIIRAVREAYPVGSVLHVTIGRSTFPVQVEEHNEFWWDSPGQMTGTNLHTGKIRRFMPDDIVDVNGQSLSSTAGTENE